MPSTTYALVLRPPRKGSLGPVHLGTASDHQPTYQAIPGLALSEKHWNEAGTLKKLNWVRKTRPAAERYNELLRKLLRPVTKASTRRCWPA